LHVPENILVLNYLFHISLTG